VIIGILTVKLHIPASNSLKAKRRVVKSIKERLRNRFNISVSEVDDHDKWQLAVVACANVACCKKDVNSTLSKALDFIEYLHLAEIIDHQIELI